MVFVGMSSPLPSELIWCIPSDQRMEYPPCNDAVWAKTEGGLLRATYHWEPGMPMPGGAWTDEGGNEIQVKAWLPLEELNP